MKTFGRYHTVMGTGMIGIDSFYVSVNVVPVVLVTIWFVSIVIVREGIAGGLSLCSVIRIVGISSRKGQCLVILEQMRSTTCSRMPHLLGHCTDGSEFWDAIQSVL